VSARANKILIKSHSASWRPNGGNILSPPKELCVAFWPPERFGHKSDERPNGSNGTQLDGQHFALVALATERVIQLEGPRREVCLAGGAATF